MKWKFWQSEPEVDVDWGRIKDPSIAWALAHEEWALEIEKAQGYLERQRAREDEIAKILLGTNYYAKDEESNLSFGIEEEDVPHAAAVQEAKELRRINQNRYGHRVKDDSRESQLWDSRCLEILVPAGKQDNPEYVTACSLHKGHPGEHEAQKNAGSYEPYDPKVAPGINVYTELLPNGGLYVWEGSTPKDMDELDAFMAEKEIELRDRYKTQVRRLKSNRSALRKKLEESVR